MKVRLLGLGAVGAPLAIRLDPVCDFAVLLSEDRIPRYRAQGTTVNGVRHDFRIADGNEDDVDLIILACKNTDLTAALPLVDRHAGAGTALMSLLNGIDSERVLEERYGEGRVIYSFITNLSSVRQGREIDLFSPRGGLIRFNEKDSVPVQRTLAVDELFTQAGIWHELSSDIIHDIWWKFAFNICINSLSAVMGLDYGMMNGNVPFYRLVRMLYSEIRRVAAAEGVRLDDGDEERCFTVLAGMDGVGKTSMLQDLEAGRQTENRYFAGTLGALARAHSIPVPITDFVFNLVAAAEEAG